MNNTKRKNNGSWFIAQRRVNNHHLVCVKGQFYQIDPDEKLANATIDIYRGTDGKLIGVPTYHPGREPFVLEELDPARIGIKPEQDVEEELNNLGTEQLRVIAQYEMWERLEVKSHRSFTKQFVDSLSKEDKKLINAYLSSKIAVLGGNTALSLQVNKKTGAEA